MNLGMVNCMRCRFRNEDNGNCTAVGGFCTAVPAAHCPLLHNYLDVGLMPDQVANAKVIIESAFAEDTSKAERIRALLKADAEGRVDVAPVVRCKDCRYFKMYKCRMGYSRYDDFCSYGERKGFDNAT